MRKNVFTKETTAESLIWCDRKCMSIKHKQLSCDYLRYAVRYLNTSYHNEKVIGYDTYGIFLLWNEPLLVNVLYFG